MVGLGGEGGDGEADEGEKKEGGGGERSDGGHHSGGGGGGVFAGSGSRPGVRGESRGEDSGKRSRVFMGFVYYILLLVLYLFCEKGACFCCISFLPTFFFFWVLWKGGRS